MKGFEKLTKINDAIARSNARAVDRVVRSMLDGVCPKCGNIEKAERMRLSQKLYCPKCTFSISNEEAAKGIKQYQEYMQESVKLFEDWRKDDKV